jgi:hypothetical protein
LVEDVEAGGEGGVDACGVGCGDDLAELGGDFVDAAEAGGVADFLGVVGVVGRHGAGLGAVGEVGSPSDVLELGSALGVLLRAEVVGEHHRVELDVAGEVLGDLVDGVPDGEVADVVEVVSFDSRVISGARLGLRMRAPRSARSASRFWLGRRAASVGRGGAS